MLYNRIHKTVSCYAGQLRAMLVVVGILLTLIFSSCKKSKLLPPSASLTMVNAMPGADILTTNFNGTNTNLFKFARKMNYKLFAVSMNQFSAYTGAQQVKIYKWPDTTDKSLPLLDFNLDLPEASITSVFLTGTPAAPEVVINRDDIPFITTGDSVMAVRFINLSPGSGPVSVNIKGEADGSTVASLPYKSLTSFSRFDVKSAIPGYDFEFRDAGSGQLLATFQAKEINQFDSNRWRYRSFTIILTGLPGGTGTTAPATFAIDHY